jgi:hypothetical protein
MTMCVVCVRDVRLVGRRQDGRRSDDVCLQRHLSGEESALGDNVCWRVSVNVGATIDAC